MKRPRFGAASLVAERMLNVPKRIDEEVKARAVRLVLEHAGEPAATWPPCGGMRQAGGCQAVAAATHRRPVAVPSSAGESIAETSAAASA